MPEPSGITYLDMETTGLGRLAQAFEVAWLHEREEGEEDAQPRTLFLEHTLDGAEPAALEVNRYWERDIPGKPTASDEQLNQLRRALTKRCLVIANPPFDTRFLDELLGYQPWHHRCSDIETYAQAIFGLRYPPGMTKIHELLIEQGFSPAEPDHTAAGDVLALASMHRALQLMGEWQRQPARWTAS